MLCVCVRVYKILPHKMEKEPTQYLCTFIEIDFQEKGWIMYMLILSQMLFYYLKYAKFKVFQDNKKVTNFFFFFNTKKYLPFGVVEKIIEIKL